MKPKIKYSEYVVGCRIGDSIYINPKLKYSNKKLFYRILDHEKEHSDGFEKKDILLDLTNHELLGFKKEYWSFVFTHPKTWVGFLPFSKIDGKWSLDVGLILIWAFAILGGALLISIL